MRYLITFSYDGSNFNGYQKQNNVRTIQEEIEKTLKTITNEDISISASGRTDAKVHAYNQKAHFDYNGNIKKDNLKKALNSLLPDDIYIKNIEEVNNDFHARFNVVKKEYIYKINTGLYNPLERNYVYQYNKTLNINKMIECSKVFIGKHNFKSFTKADDFDKDYVRYIFNIEITKQEDIVIIKFLGSGFLRYMVRNIVGALIEASENKKTKEDLVNILLSEDRTKAGITAHPEGLYLNNVFYK